jgi:hypothetical protein
MVNLSESLNRVPGLVANLRNNYAQDLQLNSRGFGARATFGIRGLRLYTDGIPPPCRMGGATCRTSTSLARSASRCCAARSWRCTAPTPAA